MEILQTCQHKRSRYTLILLVKQLRKADESKKEFENNTISYDINIVVNYNSKALIIVGAVSTTLFFMN